MTSRPALAQRSPLIEQLARVARRLGQRMLRQRVFTNLPCPGLGATVPRDPCAALKGFSSASPAHGGKGRARRCVPAPRSLLLPRDRRCHADQVAQERGACPMRLAS